jgi:ribonuclease P protein component
MLSSVHRLPKEEISEVLLRGIHVRSEFIELIYKKTTTFSRFSFIVSTKIDKRAVSRNRMRRVMSESVRHVLAKIPPMDGICIAKKNFADLPQVEVEQIVCSLLHI